MYLYTSKSLQNESVTAVPNVVGMNAVAAIQTMINRGFNVVVVGSEYYKHSNTATVKSQSVAQGTIMTKGSVITLYFDEHGAVDE